LKQQNIPFYQILHKKTRKKLFLIAYPHTKIEYFRHALIWVSTFLAAGHPLHIVKFDLRRANFYDLNVNVFADFWCAEVLPNWYWHGIKKIIPKCKKGFFALMCLKKRC